jgi:hypothetical protein
MIAPDIERLIDSYAAWLRDRTKLRRADNDWAEITTPFLDRHNDFLQIYVRKLDGNGYELTDDSYIVHDLESSGCRLDTPKRQELLRMTLLGFGVGLEGEALVTRSSESTFPQKKHALVQAMLAINDLFYLAPPIVSSLFHEDVEQWLEENEVRYSANVKLPGKSGYDHLFDFLIPKSRSWPERIIKAINRPTKDNAEAFIFSWIDTREARPYDSRAYAILNDRDHAMPPNVIDALKHYDINAVPWSRRQGARDELAA